MKNKVLYLVSMAILGVSSVKAQLNVGSTSAADPSAILQATSTTKGFLPPVMTTTQRNAIVTPAPGLLIFNSTTNQQEVNSGTTGTPIWGANTAATFYNADGTLATNRVVTQGANTLSYLGTGGIKFKSGSVNFDSSAIIGKGDSLSGGVVGVGVTANGGLNMGQNNNSNIFIGYKSGKITTGINNLFIGFQSGLANTAGNNNVFTGQETGWLNTTGSQNTFNGAYSGQFNTTGSYNTFNGQVSGLNNTTGSSNMFNGQASGMSNTTGTSNTFVGGNSGQNNTTGNNNVFSGQQSGYYNTTGGSNVFIGASSGVSNTTVSGNTFIGDSSGLYNTTGSGNVFSGFQSGLVNSSGSSNTFNGYKTGLANTTGVNNTFSGFQSGLANTTGNNNVFTGHEAGWSSTTGSQNTFNGTYSGQFNTTGNYNTFNGQVSGLNNTTGSSNMFDGQASGMLNTTGSYNTFSGGNSGQNNTTGSSNTFSGQNTGVNNTTGTNNTAFGYSAGPTSGALTNTTSIGYNTQATVSNTLILGNGANVGIGTTTPAAKLDIASTFKFYPSGTGVSGDPTLIFGSGGAWTRFGSTGGPLAFWGDGNEAVNSSPHLMISSNGSVGIGNTNNIYTLDVSGNVRSTGNMNAPAFTVTSDRRLKKNLTPLNGALSKVMQLTPYSYEKKDSLRASKYEQKEMGFLAQDVQKVFPNLVTVGKDADKLLAINYTALIPLLTKAIQEQQAQNDTQFAQIAVLTKANTSMAAQLADLKDMKIAMAAMQTELSKIAFVNKQAASNTASK